MRDTMVERAIDASPTFAGLGSETRQRLTQLGEPLHVGCDATLTWEGYRGELVYLIAKGTAAVTRAGEQLAVLGPGDVFGEVGVVDSAPRNAAIRARTQMTLVTFPAAGFEELLGADPELRARVRGQAATRRATPPARA